MQKRLLAAIPTIELGNVVIRHNKHVFHAFYFQLDSLSQSTEIITLIRVDGDIPLRHRFATEISYLRLPVGSQCKHRNGTQFEQGKNYLKIAYAIRKMHHNPVATADPSPRKLRSPIKHALPKFRISYRNVPLHHNNPIRILTNRAEKHLTKSPALPIPFFAILLRKIFWKWNYTIKFKGRYIFRNIESLLQLLLLPLVSTFVN